MEPVLTANLFLPLQTELISLLRGLAPADWSKPTLAGAWHVKDVVAHLLDGDLRRLAVGRDGYSPSSGNSAPLSYDELVKLINSFNALCVEASRRLSPRILIDLLEWSGPQLADFFSSLPPDGDALYPVAWAGEDRSTNWMDIGREYTEKWHHQAQIRDAVDAVGLMERRWLHPVLELSMYALPYAFRHSVAPAGSVFNVTIDGEAGGEWSLTREGAGWVLDVGKKEGASASARMDADTAWRLFFNALKSEEAKKRVEVFGDSEMCSMLLSTRSVMV